MNMYRCRICGDTYLGAGAPSRCPFCGADETYMVQGDGFSAEENHVQLTEIERTDLQTAAGIERSNARYYAAVARLEDDETLASAYKRLSRVEAEHCSLFCKLLREPKPDDLTVPDGDPGDWCAAIAESAAREQQAAQLYAEMVGRATNERIREVFSAVSAIERDHLGFDALAARRKECR
jgi:rubrerythrin